MLALHWALTTMGATAAAAEGVGAQFERLEGYVLGVLAPVARLEGDGGWV